MIVFDLLCGGGHVFEAWFGSSDDYEAQRRRGLLACPMCGTDEVAKAPMAPNVAAKGNQRPQPRAVAPAAPATLPLRTGGAAAEPERMKAMLHALARAQAKALEGSTFVGERFAQEARAIHEGAADERPIHGQATLAEAKALIDDGIPVAPLPLPVRPPGTDN